MVDQHIATLSTDTLGIIKQASKSFCDLSGFTHEELIERPYTFLLHPDTQSDMTEMISTHLKQGEIWQGELKYRNKAGDNIWLFTDVNFLPDDFGRVGGYIAVYRDITSEKLLNIDTLTQIGNKEHLNIALTREIDKAKRYNRLFSVILLDIDYFKDTIKIHGYQTGDHVLLQFTDLIRANLRSTDIVGRWGSDEFLILCPGTGLFGAATLAIRLRKLLEEHCCPSMESETASFGVASFGKGDTINTLIERAHAAVDKAKENGRNRVELETY